MSYIRDYSPPAQVSRYLLPSERQVMILRQHPALLLPSSAAALGGLAVALTVSTLPHTPRFTSIVVWILTILLVLRLLSIALNWLAQYMVLTNERLMLISGFFNPRIATIGLQELRDLTFERSYGGRILGFGALTIESGGRSQTLIDYIPFPEQVYLMIRGVVVEPSMKNFYDLDDPARPSPADDDGF